MYKESYDNNFRECIVRYNLQTLCISRACMDNNFEWSLLNATKPQ